ncbi:MAG: diacylglycerol kinase family protein, partial [Acidobacteriota bacterium]
AREHAEAGGIDVAFALGGDGTLREVASGLIGTPVALGALPAGTANVLTFELGLSRRPHRTARSMKGAEVRELDVGFAGDIPFLMMVSGGLDALVMANQNSAMKRRFGPAAVLAAGLRRFGSWRSPMIELEVDGRREEATFFSVCNIPFFGGPFRLAQSADASDGELDLITFTTPGRIALLRFFLGVLMGRHLRRKDVQSRRFRELKIHGPLPWGLQMDGDVLPVTFPCTVTVRHKALRVLVPTKK